MNSSVPTSPDPSERVRFWPAPASYWICQGMGWGLQLSQMVFAVVTGLVPSTGRKIPRAFVFAITGILLTHLLRYLIRRHDWRSIKLSGLLRRGFLAALGIGVALRIGSAVFNLIADYLGIPRHPSSGDLAWPGWPDGLWTLATDVFTILVWQAIYFQAHILRKLPHAEARRWRLDAAVTKAELGLLKAQLNPQFLFNCLDSLRVLVLEDPIRAQDALTRMASLLRYSLQSSSTPTVSLDEELQTVDDYLALEAIRFEERLRVRRQIDPATLRAQVPPMILQTLVENAIKYGVSKQSDPTEIEIVSQRENGAVVVAITNKGRIEANSDSTGLGLRNANDRLRRLAGRAAGISLAQSPNELVTATIRIPPGIRLSVERDSVELGEDLSPAVARRPTRQSLGLPGARDKSLNGLRRARSKNTVSSPVETEPNSNGPRFWPAPVSYWICQGIGWGLLPASQVFLHATGAEPSSFRGNLHPFVTAGSGILMTHLLRYVIRRQDWRSLPLRKLLGRGFVAALLIGAAWVGVDVTFDVVADQFGVPAQPFPETAWSEWGMRIWDFVQATVFILFWQAIYFQAHNLRQYRASEAKRWRLEAELASAELGALKAQLNPHFLFNCLNSLRALILEDSSRAQHLITRLATLLRYSLQPASTPTVSLAEELQTVDDYLDLEAIRFEERLRVRRVIDPATLRAQVPPMVVQTLVENAIKYGVAKYPGPGEIVITARRNQGEVVVAVSNAGRIESQPDSTGLGLQNATERLRRLLGPSASIALAELPNEIVTATICLPHPHPEISVSASSL